MTERTFSFSFHKDFFAVVNIYTFSRWFIRKANAIKSEPSLTTLSALCGRKKTTSYLGSQL